MNILLTSPPKWNNPKLKLKRYFLLYFSLVIIITAMISIAFGWLLAPILIIPLSIIIPYLKLPSNRIIYEIEINNENKTVSFYYFIIYKSKKKTIKFQDLKFHIDKTTELVSKKIKYHITFIYKNWTFGYISNHERLRQKWSIQDIEYLLQFYNSEIKPEHKK